MTKTYAESVAHTSAIPTIHNALMGEITIKSMTEYPAPVLAGVGYSALELSSGRE